VNGRREGFVDGDGDDEEEEIEGTGFFLDLDVDLMDSCMLRSFWNEPTIHSVSFRLVSFRFFSSRLVSSRLVSSPHFSFLPIPCLRTKHFESQ
jgi:hypothetical protein